jgi:hypothetical protein
MLKSNEHLEKTPLYDNGAFKIHGIVGPNINPGDCVLLEISTESDHCVYLGSNPINFTVISGFGRLSTMDVETGFFTEVFLEEEKQGKIEKGTAYYYSNLGSEELLIRDDCLDFNLADEPSVDEYFIR